MHPRTKGLLTTDGFVVTFFEKASVLYYLRDGKTANTLMLGEENSSAAAPISANGLVLITIPHGLLAFSAPH